MYCHSCGGVINDDDMYCGVCGAPVHKLSPPKRPVLEQTNKWLKPLIIVSLAIALLFCGFIIATTIGKSQGKIAFLRYNEQTDSSDLYIMDANGENQKVLVPNIANRDWGTEYVWSPDGKKIAYLKKDCLYVIDVEGGEPTLIAKDAAEEGDRQFAYRPSWSPDGHKIAYCKIGPEKDSDYSDVLLTTIWVMDLQNKSEYQLTHTRYQDYHNFSSYTPFWSPDGSKIAYSYGRGGVAIFVVNADGTEPTCLTFPNGLEGSGMEGAVPLWSPDGEKIAFYGEDALMHWGEGVPIYVMNADGSNIVASHIQQNAVDLKEEIIFKFIPQWSPDSTKLAYSAEKENKDDDSSTYIYIIDKQFQNKVKLTDNGFLPTWSPNGKQIAYIQVKRTENSYHEDIYLINSDGTDKKLLVNNGWRPIWSPR